MTGKIIGRGEGAGKCLDSGRISSRHVRAVPAHIQVPTKKVIRKVQFKSKGLRDSPFSRDRRFQVCTRGM